MRLGRRGFDGIGQRGSCTLRRDDGQLCWLKRAGNPSQGGVFDASDELHGEMVQISKVLLIDCATRMRVRVRVRVLNGLGKRENLSY
jgi:hypothetical protein